METLLQDFKFGFRMLVKSPSFACIAILTLALGIGANTAIFSVVHAVLLNPFPYKDPSRIMFLAEKSLKDSGNMNVPYSDFLDWKKQNQSFEKVAIARNYDFNLTGTEEPARIKGALVSADMFPLLGVAPIHGRPFYENEDREGADRVAVLSHALWQRRFGGDPSILNRPITLDQITYTVVGIMPPRFKFWGADVWVPAGLNFDGDLHSSRVARMGYFGIGRLKPGTTQEQAKTDLGAIAKRLEQSYPDSNKDIGAEVTPLTESVVSGIRPALLVLLGAVGFVLLIACANVANLLLTRATGRQKEISIRAALGAGQTRLVSQMLIETMPIAIIGALLGLLIAFAGLKALMLFIPPGSIPSEAIVSLNWQVMLFTFVIALITTILFGLVPSFQAASSGLNQTLRDESRSSTGGTQNRRARQLLVIAETALSLTLLAGAGLLIKSFYQLQDVDPGFNPDKVVQMELNLPISKYSDAHRTTAFFQQAIERLRALPGVDFAGGNGNLPFSGSGTGMPVVREGTTYHSVQELPFTQYNMVMGDYFRSLGITFRSGRDFEATDTKTSPQAVIVNETFAKKYFGGENPIGKKVKLGLPDNLNREGIIGKGIVPFPWQTIIGVVEDVKHYGLTEDPQPQAYIPYTQAPEVPQILVTMFLVVRTKADPASLIPAIRDQVWAIDRDQPIARIGLMQTLLSDTLKQPRFSMLLLGIFACVALALAIVGIYGVISYSVSQRTREVGIRMALGARKEDVLKMILRQGMTLVSIGLLAGLVITAGLVRLMKSLLYEVSAYDPLTLISVTLILAGIALAACYFPARRATRIDPMLALRYE